MAKVFRLHNAGTDTIGGWGNSNQYNSTIINSITDPAGATATREITSIPSPFARMDLVKEAFAFVNRIGLDGDTIHHKMVSHTLDIAQIFYNFDNYRESGLLELIKWDATEVDGLRNSNDSQHRLLGQTFDLFIDSDSQQFNFDRMQGLYMLRYIGPGAPDPMTIIGSTSPASLFYTSANNHDFLAGKIIFGNHQALSSNEFIALKDRHDENFIAWMYALKTAIPNFATRFPEVDRYLNLTFGRLGHKLQQRINAMTANTLYTEFIPLDLKPGVPVEILGIQLGMNAPVDIGATSDFAINSPKISVKKPLVLPSDKFARPWIYTTAPWQQNTEVPLHPGDLDRRSLPADGTRYPYLTMTDFLEDTLIQTDSNPNPEDFFDGNLKDNTGGEHSFLLPIKRKYFDYFTTEDLKRNLKMTCDNAPGGGLCVKVSLNIPVKGGVIPFERMYITDSSMLNPRNGTIKTKNFTIILFPKTRFSNGVRPDYVVGVLSSDQDWNPKTDCVSNNGTVLVPTLGPSDRNMDAVGNRVNTAAPIMPMSSYDENFDIIELSKGTLRGIAIPLWSGVAGGSVYEFAVDFGTSNTHIEYKVAGANMSKPLDIPASARQLGTFNDDAIHYPSYIIALKNNSIPVSMGGKNEIHFPMRTLLSYKKATNWATPTAPYITGNMPFYYGEISPAEYNELKSDLKWSNDSNIVAMVECYLGSLMHIMRNKVVMEGGSLPHTKIRWFYPTSMPAATVANISNIWSRLYRRHFGPNGTTNLEAMPESIAPYQYYQNTFGAGVDVLTVDIGGGTSDAYIVDSNGRPAYITSFRFAANSLLGDGFVANGLATNGFVSKYRPIFNNILQANNLGNLYAILEEVAQAGVSADYISLLFGLKDNSDVVSAKCQDKVDFLQMLQTSEGAKTLVLIFYTAVIYHLASFIKAKKQTGANIQEPAVLAFSGNGSKLLQVLGVNTAIGKEVLSSYTKAIFEKVNGRPYAHSDFKIVIDPDKPKEATCKGGLLIKQTPSLAAIQDMTDTLIGTSETEFLSGKKYKDISESDWQGLDNTIRDFTRVFFELAKEQKIQANFGTVSLTALEANRPIFASGVKLRTSNALTFMGLLGSQNPIEDTLFFYPITEMLNQLAQKIL
ncbi:MAG: hypothetical protein HDS38_06860 [Bacteroides sp.]|nr:hypothetical protein [Bacteroides sp.]